MNPHDHSSENNLPDDSCADHWVLLRSTQIDQTIAAISHDLKIGDEFAEKISGHLKQLGQVSSDEGDYRIVYTGASRKGLRPVAITLSSSLDWMLSEAISNSLDIAGLKENLTDAAFEIIRKQSHAGLVERLKPQALHFVSQMILTHLSGSDVPDIEHITLRTTAVDVLTDSECQIVNELLKVAFARADGSNLNVVQLFLDDRLDGLLKGQHSLHAFVGMPAERRALAKIQIVKKLRWEKHFPAETLQPRSR